MFRETWIWGLTLLVLVSGFGRDLEAQSGFADIGGPVWAPPPSVDPPRPFDNRFVWESEDGQMLFNDDGPIEVDIKIDRYLGETDGDGHLVDWHFLVSQNMLSRHATLTIYAYDVDYEAENLDLPDRPERDQVWFNDKSYGFLRGENLKWSETKIQIPIEELKFPSAPGAEGTSDRPEAVENKLRVDIDVGTFRSTISGRRPWVG